MTISKLLSIGTTPKSESENRNDRTSFVTLCFVITFSLCAFFVPQATGQDFITEWKFDEPVTQITFDALTNGPVEYTWSTAPSGNSGSGSFALSSPQTAVLSGLEIEAGDVVTLAMKPQNLMRFFMVFDSDSDQLTNVVQWGAVEWTSMHNTFWGCENLTISASDSPNLTYVTNMSGMFNGASSFNQDISSWDVSNVTEMIAVFSNAHSFNQDLAGWDVSGVTTMERIFSDAIAFNGDISGWDVSNVTEMSDMFLRAESFNRDIGDWNVSNVLDMSSMFRDAVAFNQDISGWDMSNVTDMDRLFMDAENFNQDIGIWDVSSVTDMRHLFRRAVSFNQDIGNWDVSAVEDMRDMFNNADSFNQYIGDWDVSNVVDMEDMFGNNDAFNQDIGGWDVSNVENMKDMFDNATVFNQYIGDWDVSRVTDMSSMFEGAIVFNQDIGNWDVSGVEEMNSMFEEAAAFNQDIGNWDVSNVEGMWDMFRDAVAFNQNLGNWILHPDVALTRALQFSGLDCDNYSATLIGWHANNPEVTGRTLGADGLQFGTNAAEARDSLITAQGWTIVNDSPSGVICDGTLSADLVASSDKQSIIIYPNPTPGKLVLSGSPAELGHVSLINAQGQDVTAKVSIIANSAGEKEIDISRLGAGFYVVRTATTSKIVVKQ